MRIALLIDDEFEDSEFIYPYHRLQEAGHSVDIIGKKAGAYFGKHETRADASLGIDDAISDRYDALYIPGGYAPERLCKIPEMIAFVQAMRLHGKIICAVCHGPLLLAEAGILKGQRVTGYGTTKERLERAGADYSGESVVADGDLITARDPKSLPEMTTLLLQMLHDYTL